MLQRWKGKIISGWDHLRQGKFFLLVETLIAHCFPGWLCRMKKSLFYKLDSSLANVRSRDNQLEIICGTESTVQEIVNDLYDSSPKDLAFYERYYRDGIEPWIACSDGKVVGVIWLYTGSYLAMWEGYDAWLLNVQFEHSGKFFANVFTDPASRGKGVFSLIAKTCFAAYPESPFYSCIEASNTASIRSHEKIGFQRCGCAYFIRFFQMTFCLFLSKKKMPRFVILKRGQATNVVLGKEQR